MDHKQLVGEHVAQFLKDNQQVGVGTGSTVSYAIEAIAKRIKSEKLNVAFVSTSFQTSHHLASLGLTVLDISNVPKLDWGFDGADAIDPKRNAIKGKGGAMLREKIMAVRCQEYYLIIDQSKLCADIVKHCPVPVEILPDALVTVEAKLKTMPIASLDLRMSANIHGPVITEKGNFIVDVNFLEFSPSLEGDLKKIVGVVETGLFLNYASKVFVAEGDNIREF